MTTETADADGRGNPEDALGLTAYLFDLDGVVTRTASVHSEAWKRLFDAYLKERAADSSAFVPFRLPDDYVTYVDGKPRYDGVRSFLDSRGIQLPEGTSDDPPDAETVRGLGNRKNVHFNAVMAEKGVEVFDATVRIVRLLRAQGRRVGCVSSSKNCRPILARAGLEDLFEVIVDGNDAEALGLAGKPNPESFLAGAALLGIEPAQTAVVEDAVAGVQAGKAGGFGLVIGIDRGAGKDALRQAGADIVVSDMAELEPSQD